MVVNMRGVSNWFHKQNIRRKTRAAFLCVSLIPLTILGGFCFIETSNLLIKQAESNLESSLEQASLTMNAQLDMYYKINSALCYNKPLALAANTEYTSQYAMFDQLRYTIDELFVTTGNLAPGIEGITLYTSTNLPAHGKTVASYEAAKTMPWFEKAEHSVTAVWDVQKDGIYCIQPILYSQITQPKQNLIVTKINEDEILRSVKLLSEREMGVILIDSAGNVIYESSPYQLENITLFQKENLTSKRIYVDGEKYTIQREYLPAADWSLILYVPTGQLDQSAGWIMLTVAIMVFICVILIYLTSKTFASLLVHRIELLRENMQIVEDGELQVHVVVEEEYTDEISALVLGFGRMVEKIKQLIEENYQAAILQKEFEMKALQAQINPHFLYNSLSLINWRAIRIKAFDISEMSQLLSSFYRTTLNKGSNLITVADELTNVKSYTKIQLIMHSDSFDAEYEVDEAVLSQRMPNLMLQPLVENAILHGIENLEGRHGHLKIACYQQNENICFSVEDNGIGIAADEIPKLLEKNTVGYGIKNVHDRAKLLCGEEYGLTIESTVGSSTKVVLMLKGL